MARVLELKRGKASERLRAAGQRRNDQRPHFRFPGALIQPKYGKDADQHDTGQFHQLLCNYFLFCCNVSPKSSFLSSFSLPTPQPFEISIYPNKSNPDFILVNSRRVLSTLANSNLIKLFGIMIFGRNTVGHYNEISAF